MSDNLTDVTIHNPMFEMTYTFPCDKEMFERHFRNQLSGCGYFMDTTTDGKLVTINPSICSAIEIKEIEFKG